MRLFPVDAQRAPVHEHDDERLPGCGHSANQGFLAFGHFEIGPVSMEKPGLFNR